MAQAVLFEPRLAQREHYVRWHSKKMQNLTSLPNIVIGFLLIGFAANWLIQRWQYRNWINQQRFLGSEKKYEALKAHADEISKSASKRLSAMFRLVFALDQSEERLEERRKIYSEALDDWNQHINSFYYKTTMYFNWGMTKKLEDTINQKFVEVGAKLESQVRSRQANGKFSEETKEEILDGLYSLQGRLGNFNRDMLRFVLRQYSATYHGIEIRYNEIDLEYFSTWQLFKALFITRIDEFRIILTAFELERPARSRD